MRRQQSGMVKPDSDPLILLLGVLFVLLQVSRNDPNERLSLGFFPHVRVHQQPTAFPTMEREKNVTEKNAR